MDVVNIITEYGGLVAFAAYLVYALRERDKANDRWASLSIERESRLVEALEANKAALDKLSERIANG